MGIPEKGFPGFDQKFKMIFFPKRPGCHAFTSCLLVLHARHPGVSGEICSYAYPCANENIDIWICTYMHVHEK